MDQIEEVRRKTDLVQLISESVNLKKAGRNFKGLCPFHEEKSPSFMVSQERQIWKCFGCQEGGDAFKFVMRKEGLDFGEALRMLADKAGIKLESFKPTQEQQIKERLVEINHLASEYFHYLLTGHESGKKALEYLLKRGVTRESIKTFKLGWAPEEWQGVQNFLVKKKQYKNEELEQAGLVIKGGRTGFYDRFRGRVMFPLFDFRGRVVGFSGRVLEPDVKEAKYVNSPETILYNKSNLLYGLEITKEAIKKADKAVVVEGELDAIASYQVGVKNVVAIKGSAFTEEQVELLKRFCEHAALALDSDTAGQAATMRGLEMAENAGLNVRIIQLLYGKDPDECIRKEARLWKDSVKAAVPVYDFYISAAVKKYGVESPEGKRQVSGLVAPVLAKINNQVIKAHYIKKLAEVLKVNEEAVAEEVDKAPYMKVFEKQNQTAKPAVRTRQEMLEEYLLAILLQKTGEIKAWVETVETTLLTDSAVKKIMEKLKQNPDKNQAWPAELEMAANAAWLTDLGELTEDEEKLFKEWEKTKEELGKIKLREELAGLTAAVKKAEEEKDKAALKTLEQEFVKIAQQLKTGDI
ncbi:MAG: DNA primase [Patescibacteria group bacterium]